MSNAVDLAGKLNAITAGNLAKNGVTHVGRYLSHTTWKGLDLNEVSFIKKVGLQIFSIYETNPTALSYFTAKQGQYDAVDAMSLAQAIQQPAETAIYFTVDYDAQPADFNSILAYFQAVKANLKGYKLGCYGSYSVLNFLQSKGIGDYYFQTVAWSGGQRCSFLNIYQYQCDKPFAGLTVDLDNFEKADVGAWGQPQAHAQSLPQSPWKKENGLWFYYENGVKKCNAWVKYKDKWYYLKADGAMAQGWIQYKNNWYYLNPAADRGEMLTGWIHDNGKTYYCNPAPDKGEMFTGVHVIDGKSYSFKINGELIQ